MKRTAIPGSGKCWASSLVSLSLHILIEARYVKIRYEPLAEEVQQITGRSVELSYVDQGYTGQAEADAAAQHGIQLQVVNTPKQSEASCCCQEGGLSREASPGPRVSANSPEITNDSDTASPDTTTSPSLGSCSLSSQTTQQKAQQMG